jgi:nicotinate-nucleotide adenylyltransferase
MHIALAALRHYKFHAIWWMVSPQNPLKNKKNNFKTRLRMTQKFVQHPKMVVCDLEEKLHTQYSLQTVQMLKRHYPRTQFTWIAGMDNACIFHRWDGWQRLLSIIPFAFFNRPPTSSMAVSNNAIRMFKGQKNARFHLTGKTRNISSTQLRKKRFVNFLKSDVY